MQHDSRGFPVLQTLPGVATLRQVLLGVPKQPPAEYPDVSHRLSSNDFPQTDTALHPELGTAQPAFAISGQANYPSHLHADGQVEMVVAVFQPHALRAFLNLPVSLLHNQEVSGYDLENKHLKRLAAQIADCGDAPSCIRVTERWLLSQIADGLTSKTAYNIQRISAAVGQLLAMPATSRHRTGLDRLPEQETVRTPVQRAGRCESQGICQNSPFPEITGTVAALPARCQSGTAGLPMRLRRPVAFYPGVQAIQRPYPLVLAQGMQPVFRLVQQPRITSPLCYP